MLRNFRIFLAFIVFVAVAFLFLDVHHLANGDWIKTILQFQFMPSFLSFIKNGLAIPIGLIVITLLTLLFGRIYCSVVCPLGISFDAVSRLNAKKFRRKIWQFQEENRFVRYLFVTITFLPVLAGITSALLLLDPYSNFGRIVTNIFRPALIGINNSLAFLLEKAGVYMVDPIPFHYFPMGAFLFSTVLLIALFGVAYKKGRYYCNTICPVGTVLGLLSRFSLFKFQFNEKCTACGKCEVKCKSQCVDVANRKVDHSRCVVCFDCVSSCPVGGMTYQMSLNKKPEKEGDMAISTSRRSFLGLMAALPAVTVENVVPDSLRKKYKNLPPVTPPGSKSVAAFTEKCVACHICVSKCPSQVLQPTLMKYGLFGLLMPRMNFDSGYCNYECTVCGEVCPTDAIKKFTFEEKKQIQIGKVVFVRENCVVIKDKKDCGACAEHCPTKACTMIQVEGENLREPKVNPEICVGCGACEHACPQKVEKAIFVDSNFVHQKAKLPVLEKLPEPEVGNFGF